MVVDFNKNITVLDKKSVSSNNKLDYSNDVILPIPKKLYFEPKEIIINYDFTYTTSNNVGYIYGVNNAYSTVCNDKIFTYDRNVITMKPSLVDITEKGIKINFKGICSSINASGLRKFTFIIYAMILLGIEVKIDSV